MFNWDLLWLGGPVFVGLALLSVATLAVIFWKTWRFRKLARSGSRAHKSAMAVIEPGHKEEAVKAVSRSNGYLVPIVREALVGRRDSRQRDRLYAELECELSRFETGLRFLDVVTQVAPLLGLFGTVLGMIEAFQALQDAGPWVDPSALAGGIWVALLTTAFGLVIAMIAYVTLSWFEARIEAERLLAEAYLARAFAVDEERNPNS